MLDITRLPKGWSDLLKDQVEMPYFQELERFLESEYGGAYPVYPKQSDLFNALKATDIHKVKVVILGQDPYHGEGQAHGLAFSVQEEQKIPPSLRNIYKEIHQDLGLAIPNHGNLSYWAEQGVLLLNTVFSVRQGQAGSHQKKGWEAFTDRIIEGLNDNCAGLVFMLWGSPAQKKADFVDESKHLVLRAVHPSPLSAHRGFFGCKHFSKSNLYLQSQGKTAIDWQIRSQGLLI